jgi:hypothetical protein
VAAANADTDRRVVTVEAPNQAADPDAAGTVVTPVDHQAATADQHRVVTRRAADLVVVMSQVGDLVVVISRPVVTNRRVATDAVMVSRQVAVITTVSHHVVVVMANQVVATARRAAEAPVTGPVAANGQAAQVAVNRKVATVLKVTVVKPGTMAEVQAIGPLAVLKRRDVTVMKSAEVGPVAVVNRKGATAEVRAIGPVAPAVEVVGRAAANHQAVTVAVNRVVVTVAVNRKVAMAEGLPIGPVVLPAVTIARVTTEATGPAVIAVATNLRNATTIPPARAQARVTANAAHAPTNAADAAATTTIAAAAAKAKDRDGAAVMAATKASGTSALAKVAAAKANNAAGLIEPPMQSPRGSVTKTPNADVAKMRIADVVQRAIAVRTSASRKTSTNG